MDLNEMTQEDMDGLTGRLISLGRTCLNAVGSQIEDLADAKIIANTYGQEVQRFGKIFRYTIHCSISVENDPNPPIEGIEEKED